MFLKLSAISVRKNIVSEKEESFIVNSKCVSQVVGQLRAARGGNAACNVQRTVVSDHLQIACGQLIQDKKDNDPEKLIKNK